MHAPRRRCTWSNRDKYAPLREWERGRWRRDVIYRAVDRRKICAKTMQDMVLLLFCFLFCEKVWLFDRKLATSWPGYTDAKKWADLWWDLRGLSKMCKIAYGTYIIDFIACFIFCDLGERLTWAKLWNRQAHVAVLSQNSIRKNFKIFKKRPHTQSC